MIVRQFSKHIVHNLHASYIARRSLLAMSLTLFLLFQQTFAVSLPPATPAAVGMSTARLSEMEAVVAQSIERKEMPGAVVLVGRRGRGSR